MDMSKCFDSKNLSSHDEEDFLSWALDAAALLLLVETDVEIGVVAVLFALLLLPTTPNDREDRRDDFDLVGVVIAVLDIVLCYSFTFLAVSKYWVLLQCSIGFVFSFHFLTIIFFLSQHQKNNNFLKCNFAIIIL